MNFSFKKKKQTPEYKQKQAAIIERYFNTGIGIPRYVLKLRIIAIRVKDVSIAPRLSTKKILLGLAIKK